MIKIKSTSELKIGGNAASWSLALLLVVSVFITYLAATGFKSYENIYAQSTGNLGCNTGQTDLVLNATNSLPIGSLKVFEANIRGERTQVTVPIPRNINPGRYKVYTTAADTHWHDRHEGVHNQHYESYYIRFRQGGSFVDTPGYTPDREVAAINGEKIEFGPDVDYLDYPGELDSGPRPDSHDGDSSDGPGDFSHQDQDHSPFPSQDFGGPEAWFGDSINHKGIYLGEVTLSQVATEVRLAHWAHKNGDPAPSLDLRNSLTIAELRIECSLPGAGGEWEVVEPRASFARSTARPGDIVRLSLSARNDKSGQTTDVDGGAIRVVAQGTRGFSGNRLVADDQIIDGLDTRVWNIDYAIPANAAPGSQYCVRAVFSADGGGGDDELKGITGGVIEEEGPIRSSEDCITIQEQYFLKTYGAGVWAGAYFDSSGLCTPASTATGGFNSQIRSITSGDYGSSTEYAATATGNISGFSSGVRGSTDVRNKNALTFENSSSFGNFTTTPLCLDNLYQEFASQSPASATWGQVRSRSGYGSQNSNTKNADLLRLSPGIISGGTFEGKSVVIVNGDLSINGNINYGSNYGTGNNPRINSLVIVVRGDINISPNVNNIDALLIAIPSGGSGGQINTCSGNINACRNNPQRLVVNGALIAESINFGRLFGGIGAADTGQYAAASERIEFSPELYLANPFEGLLESGGVASEIQSLIELPPSF